MLTTEKIAVQAPMPSARVRMATAVKLGRFDELAKSVAEIVYHILLETARPVPLGCAFIQNVTR